MRMRLTGALMLAALFAGPVRGADDEMPKDDKGFLIRAIAMETAEVTIADVAAKGAANEDVRKLAKKISEDHTKSRDALTQQAKDMKLGIVAGLTKEQRGVVAKLRLMKGNEFDKAFLQHVIDSHTSGEKMYEKWSSSTKDAGLKKMATKYQATAKDHLKKAKELQKQLGE